MPNIVDKFISEKEEKGIILTLYKQGLRQDEIEHFILDKFRPYLKSKSILRLHLLVYLSQYIDTLLYILSDPENKVLFEKCLEVYWEAKAIDLDECYRSYQYWQEEVLAATSKIVTMIILDQDRTTMNLHEFAEDVFTKIGKIIEACIQPHLRILFFLENIINHKKSSKIDIDKLILGVIVDKLNKYKIFNNIIIPPPWNVKLNHWRNISKHDSYSIEDNKIVCKYKKPPNQKKVVLLQPELWKLFLVINDIFGILRLAHSVFFLDNIDEIRQYWEPKQLRKESGLLDQIDLYRIFGFSAEGYALQDDKVTFRLIEQTSGDPDARLNQLISLIRPTWYKTRKRIIVFEYYDSLNNPLFIVEADTSKKKELFSLDVDEKFLTLENLKECITVTDLRDV